MKKLIDYFNEAPEIKRYEWIIIQFIVGITASIQMITVYEWLK